MDKQRNQAAQSDAEERAFAAAQIAATEARAHADERARQGGHERFGSLWLEDAIDHLNRQRAALGRPAYWLACELVRRSF
jgi:hypothetical protein